MPRPRKNPEDRKNYHLRVPLTDAQRALVEQASQLEELDLAAWSRAVLLDAARRRVKRSSQAGGKPAQ